MEFCSNSYLINANFPHRLSQQVRLGSPEGPCLTYSDENSHYYPEIH